MWALFRIIRSPLWSLALLMSGNGFFTTFLSIRLKMEGYDPTMIGYIHSAYYAGFLIGAIKTEKLIGRIKHIRAFAVFASIATAIIMIQGMIASPYSWIITRFLTGLCLAALYVVIESWFLVISPESMRGRVLSFYMIGLYASQAFSQFIIDAIDLVSMAPFFITGLLSSLSVVPVALTHTEVPDLQQPNFRIVFQIFRSSPLGFFGCLISGCILSSIYSFTPLFGQATNISVSYLMSLTIAGGFLLQWPIGRMSDLFDRRHVIVGVSLAALLPSLAIIFTTGFPNAVFALSFILGGLCFTLYPLSITHSCDRLQPEHITSATGALLLIYSIGSVIGPLIAPLFMHVVQHPSGLYAYNALGCLVLAGFGWYKITKQPPVPKEDQSRFVALPRATAVAYELDPRAVEEENPAENTTPPPQEQAEEEKEEELVTQP